MSRKMVSYSVTSSQRMSRMNTENLSLIRTVEVIHDLSEVKFGDRVKGCNSD